MLQFLFIILFLISTSVFSGNNFAGKGLICAYGKNKDVYEAYLFFSKNFVSKFLFLEKNSFKIRENEKRSYFVTKKFINFLPFKIDRMNLQVIDTEFNKTIGSCFQVNSHQQANNFMDQFKLKTQKEYNKTLKGHEV